MNLATTFAQITPIPAATYVAMTNNLVNAGCPGFRKAEAIGWLKDAGWTYDTDVVPPPVVLVPPEETDVLRRDGWDYQGVKAICEQDTDMVIIGLGEDIEALYRGVCGPLQGAVSPLYQEATTALATFNYRMEDRCLN